MIQTSIEGTPTARKSTKFSPLRKYLISHPVLLGWRAQQHRSVVIENFTSFR
jgi:hypothetical protein